MPVPGMRDQLFLSDQYPRRFSFNEDVARVFDDMVRRSIPMYEDVLNCAAEWTYKYYREGSTVYDLGCSTGSTLLALSSSLPDHPSVRLVGLDQSAAMVAKAKEKIATVNKQCLHPIDVQCADISNYAYEPTSVFIVNYTLQFLTVAKRRELLQNLYEHLLPGGLLFVSEKICSPYAEIQEQTTRSYERFKLNNGYSQSEIALKKEALDQVLITLSTRDYFTMFSDIGFAAYEQIFRWNNFATMVAIKRA